MDVRFAYQANCWGPLGGNAVGVTSIGQLPTSPSATSAARWREIGEAGYSGVELFDGNVLDYPGGVNALKADLGQLRRQAGRDLFRRQIHLRRRARSRTRAHRPRRRCGCGALRRASRRRRVAKRLEGVATRRLRAPGWRPGKGRRHRQSARPKGPLSSPSLDDRRRACRGRPDFRADLDQVLPRHRASGRGRRRCRRDGPQASSRISYVHLKGCAESRSPSPRSTRATSTMRRSCSALADTDYSGWIPPSLTPGRIPKAARRSLAFLKSTIAGT